MSTQTKIEDVSLNEEEVLVATVLDAMVLVLVKDGETVGAFVGAFVGAMVGVYIKFSSFQVSVVVGSKSHDLSSVNERMIVIVFEVGVKVIVVG